MPAPKTSLLPFALCSLAVVILAACAVSTPPPNPPSPAAPTPAPPAPKISLYIVGDSTAAASTEPTIEGWGVPFQTYFDPDKIHVVNAALGGRSSRTYITEGHLDSLAARLNPGDIVLLQFGHNDPYPLNDEKGRGSLFGAGDETEEIIRSTTHKPETIHTYGWYMRKMIDAVQAKGAKPIVLTLTVRDKWISDKIERDLIQTTRPSAAERNSKDRDREPTRFSVWAADVARAASVPLLDVHDKIADRYDAQGKAVVSTYFHSPKNPTHANPLGAAINAQETLACLKTYQGSAFDQYLNDKGKSIPPASPDFIFTPEDMVAPLANRFANINTADSTLNLQPFAYAQGSLNEEQDSPTTKRTGKILLALAGDSTVTFNAGYAAGLRSHFDKQLQVVNLSHGGRTTATFRSEHRWQQVLDLKPDYVLIQFGHNDEAVMSLYTYRQNLVRFVEEARAAGIKPILATPISRRYFGPDGKIHSDLIGNSDIVRKIAAKMNVPLLDLQQRSIEIYEAYGPDKTNWGLAKPNPATQKSKNPSTMPQVIYDKTHFNAQGSQIMGKMVAQELKIAVPELAIYINPDHAGPTIVARSKPAPSPDDETAATQSESTSTTQPTTRRAATRPAFNPADGLPVTFKEKVKHPALFLVGDSITGTGKDNLKFTGPRGWGWEIIPMFDPSKIHVYNVARGGRSSRGYIEEGSWKNVLAQMQPGDFVTIQFGNNDTANSKNYPDRISAPGDSDDLADVAAPGGKKKVHSYGWYMRKYATEAQAKGATAIILSCAPRNYWTDNKIRRGFDGFVAWSAAAAKEAHCQYIDLNALIADQYDALGQKTGSKLFFDKQHPQQAAAEIYARCVEAGLLQINSPLGDDFLPLVQNHIATTQPATAPGDH